MCTQYLHYIHPSIPSLPILLLPTSTTSAPRQDLFLPPVLQFCKRKKITFLFV
jgi:hypothetical protein